MKALVTVLAIYFLGVFLLVAAACTWGGKVTLLEMNKYPYDMKILGYSHLLLSGVLLVSPDNAWANVAMSQAALNEGYKSGDLYYPYSFEPSAIDKAYIYASKAVQADPQNSRAFAQLARVEILQGQYKVAWSVLDRAFELDHNSFYAWYYLAVLNRFYQLYPRAKLFADHAMELAQYEFQRRWVFDELITVAERQGDDKTQDKLYRAEINLDPNRTWSYGNYAAFLYDHGRYKEAIFYLEKAIQIGDYPIAEHLLEKAKAALQQQMKPTSPANLAVVVPQGWLQLA